MEREESPIGLRLQRIVEGTMELLEQLLEDPGQFLQPGKRIGENGEEEPCQKLDTRALKEFVSVLKELKALAGEEQTAQGLRVVFEAGEDAFNE